jgi:hypothetical protein
MKRQTPRLAAAIAALTCLHPIYMHAGSYSAAPGRVGPGAAVTGMNLPLAPMNGNMNPAHMSGVPSFQVIQGGLNANAAISAAAASAKLLALPAAAAAAPKAQTSAASSNKAATAHGTLGAIGAAIAAQGDDKSAKDDKGEISLNKAFDGSNNGGGANGGGGVGGGSGGSDRGEGGLGRLYPRVVMILDTLAGPASDKLVKQIEKLADAGVRVVFVTARVDKGEDSAESVLVSKLKRRVGNPVIVVSANGARITAHNSKAEHPKPLIEDLDGLSANAVAAFQKIGKASLTKQGVKGELVEFGVPAVEGAHIYGAELPAGADLKKFVSSYNEMLRNRGMKYKVEGVAGPDGRNYFFTQSTALKLNTSRLFNAVFAQNPDLRGSLTREQVLVLADSTKAANFLKSLSQTEEVSGKGFFIHGVKDEASTVSALDAVLGNAALDKVVVTRSQLRAYSEWLDARAKWGTSPRSAGSGSGFSAGKKGGRFSRDLGFYRGIIMYDLMGRLYHLLRNGQYANASPEAAQDLLEAMWKNPRANGVRINDEMDASLRALRKTAWGRQMLHGYYDTAKTWLRGYYKRNLPNFPIGVSEKVVGTMINLARDSKNQIVLEYASPYTGRRYTIHALPARAHLERDDQGNLLVAHVYRTGKEPYEAEFEDSVETNLMAAMMLAGYADKRDDGKWYVNDEANPRVKVVFHYMTRDLNRIMTPEELEASSQEVTTLIEKMQADPEFLEHWNEQQEAERKAAEGAKKSAARRAAKPAKKGKKA